MGLYKVVRVDVLKNNIQYVIAELWDFDRYSNKTSLMRHKSLASVCFNQITKKLKLFLSLVKEYKLSDLWDYIKLLDLMNKV